MTTTIKLSDETKEWLEQEQLDGETFDATVKRLLGKSGGSTWTEQEIREIAEEVLTDKALSRRL